MEWGNSEHTVLVLDGRLDHDTVPSIRKDLRRSMQRSTVSKLTVDLSRVEYMDTAGIALLVEWHRLLAKHNGKLALSGLNGDLRRRISLARVDRLFELPTLGDLA
jgi:anti-anti-sigma factor